MWLLLSGERYTPLMSKQWSLFCLTNPDIMQVSTRHWVLNPEPSSWRPARRSDKTFLPSWWTDQQRDFLVLIKQNNQSSTRVQNVNSFTFLPRKSWDRSPITPGGDYYEWGDDSNLGPGTLGFCSNTLAWGASLRFTVCCGCTDDWLQSSYQCSWTEKSCRWLQTDRQTDLIILNTRRFRNKSKYLTDADIWIDLLVSFTE